jgi:hypothetical protein
MHKLRSKLKRAGALGLGVVLVASVGIACSRSVPASFPIGSAASTAEAEAPAAQVGVVLAADPPLPGESTIGWPGLEEADAGDAPAAGSVGHQHHQAAAPDGGAHGSHEH